MKLIFRLLAAIIYITIPIVFAVGMIITTIVSVIAVPVTYLLTGKIIDITDIISPIGEFIVTKMTNIGLYFYKKGK